MISDKNQEALKKLLKSKSPLEKQWAEKTLKKEFEEHSFRDVVREALNDAKERFWKKQTGRDSAK